MNVFDKLYNSSTNVWGHDADDIFKLGLSYLNGKNVLDLGVGDGRNALYLISNGFYVTGIDISRVGLNNIYESLKKNNQEKFFHGIIADLNNYSIEKKYGNIVCNYLLHFLDYNIAINLLEQIKENTEMGGINILSGFSLDGDLKLSSNSGVFDLNFFKSFYKGWEFIFAESSNEKVTEKSKDGSDKYNKTYNIIVKK